MTVRGEGQQDHTRIDWSQGLWKEMLVHQRQTMWQPDSLALITRWLGFELGMTAVDVGCGQGHLGKTFWPAFGKAGTYIGVDVSPELIREADRSASEWAVDGETVFVQADACSLPFRDSTSDITMCQTLLMHLAKPEVTLAEMVRVTKPGGLVVCIEPDNVVIRLAPPYSSLGELEIDDILTCARVHLTAHRGRVKRGQGDKRMGPKVAHMMTKVGLTDVGVRLNDKVFYLEPPYPNPVQRLGIKGLRRQVLDETIYMQRLEQEFRDFQAGGGDSEIWERYLEIDRSTRDHMRRQVESGEYFICCVAGELFITRGRKPA